MRKKKLAISFIISIFCCLPAQASELCDYKSARCIMHIHTDISTGRRSIESYVKEAQDKGIQGIILTDTDWRRWEYGLPPFRCWIKRTVQEKSVMTFGIEEYLRLLEQLNAKYQDVVIIDGVQTTPFYYWSGSCLTATLTMNNRNKDMLVVGLSDADAYRDMPLIANYRSRFNAYCGDKFTRPYQDLINYVIQKGGLIFWSHPEYEEKALRRRIRLITHPYHWDLLGTFNYTGFAIFWHGYESIGKPKGIWDKILLEYCQARRIAPIWAIGELEEEGLGNVELDDVVNVLYVRDLSRGEILEALREGRFYVAFQPADKTPLVLDEFTLADESGANVAMMGEEASFSGSPIIKINISYEQAADANIIVKLIRNNEIVEEFSGKSRLEIEFKDANLSAGQKYYYRIEVAGQLSSRLISNPIFFRKIFEE